MIIVNCKKIFVIEPTHQIKFIKILSRLKIQILDSVVVSRTSFENLIIFAYIFTTTIYNYNNKESSIVISITSYKSKATW